MRISNAVGEYVLASILVVSIVLLNLYGKAGDGTIQSLTNMLGLFIAALIGRGSAMGASARAGDDAAEKVSKAVNGHVDRAIARAVNVPTIPDKD